jgi:leader peptidase (prepilin peptidase) / N-methyltransferase
MDWHLTLFWAISFFLLGAIVGSFLNVVIIRLPLGQSIVYPGSRCPQCGHEIRFYDNIPVLSFVLLMARCRDCGAHISWRYPLIEFTSACLCALLFRWYGLTPAFAVLFVYSAAMLVVFWIDLDHMIIPDVITLNGLAIGVIAATVGIIPNLSWKSSLLGALLGGLIVYVPAWIYEKIRGIEGLGGGDIKLLTMVGAFSGPYGVVFVLFLSSFVGTFVALAAIGLKRGGSTTPIPFGPFLTSSAVLYLFVGQWVVETVFGHYVFV